MNLIIAAWEKLSCVSEARRNLEGRVDLLMGLEHVHVWNVLRISSQIELLINCTCS